jgi:hypothetical protein
MRKTRANRRLSDYSAATIRRWLAAATRNLGTESGIARALRGELDRRAKMGRRG